MKLIFLIHELYSSCDEIQEDIGLLMTYHLIRKAQKFMLPIPREETKGCGNEVNTQAKTF